MIGGKKKWNKDDPRFGQVVCFQLDKPKEREEKKKKKIQLDKIHLACTRAGELISTVVIENMLKSVSSSTSSAF